MSDMEAANDFEDPFNLKDLWQVSGFKLEALPSLEPVDAKLPVPDITSTLFSSSLYDFTKNDSLVYEINVFGTENTENLSIEPFDQSQAVTDDESTDTNCGPEEGEHDTLYDFDSLLECLEELPEDKTKLASWDSFLNRDYQEPASAYLSEFGNRGYDAALSHQATVSGLENAGRIVRTSVFLACSVRLGLGWNSMLFHYNEKRRTFQKTFQDIRISGLSLTALDAMINEIAQCGTYVQRMRRFVRENPSANNQSSTLSSLASAVSVLLYSLEKQLMNHLRDNVTLIQVHTLFQKCGNLVRTVAEMITAAETSRSESEVISKLLACSEEDEQRFPWLTRTLHELVQRCTKPWLAKVETWIGLRSDKSLSHARSMSRSFVEVEEENWRPDNTGRKTTAESYIFHPEFVPSSLPIEQARLMFETGKALRLLKQNQPEHPISRADVVEAAKAPGLICAFSWAQIADIQKKANDYECLLRQEIKRYNRGDISRSRPGTQHGPEEGEIRSTLTDDNSNAKQDTAMENAGNDPYKLIDLDTEPNVTGLLATNEDMESDEMYRNTKDSEYFSPHSLIQHEAAFGPPLGSVLHLSLSPTLSVQAKLVDFSCLHLLFQKHKLRQHVDLQWRFHLLGDGIFASRLSHALFDPEMTSGERKSGVARGGFHTGLRLGSRDTWPPASSELRLVLTGLLSECYDAAETGLSLSTQHETGDRQQQLPGNLSFAIRELTGNDLVRCKDPNAIEALDFLRLQYKPSNIIESVITPIALEKYDQLFKYLLRILRMTSVGNNLIRDSTVRSSLSGDTHNILQKFRIESHHFINALNDYVFQVAIGMNWQRFQDALFSIESCIQTDDIDGTIEVAGSLHRLRKYHQDVLDQILFSLFLEDPKGGGRRHSSLKQANKLIEEIFATILAFMPLSRLDGEQGIRSQHEKTVYRLHATFRKLVGSLVKILRGLDGQRALTASSTRAGIFRENVGSMSARPTSSIFEYLLLRLDMKPYY